jgi:RNA polymerase sigma-70 factor (ECF subfamily)
MLSEHSAPANAAPSPLAAMAHVAAVRHRRAAADLVSRASAGDRQAMSRLLDEQRPRIVGLTRFFTGRPEDAEDLAQDILLRLVEALPALESPETFDVWVYRLSRNRCVDFFRRRRFEAGWAEHAEPSAVMWRSAPDAIEEALATREQVARLRAAIRALPAVWRRAIVLRDLRDLSYEEVAARLRVPIGTVKSRINRGRARLVRVLADGRQPPRSAGVLPS